MEEALIKVLGGMLEAFDIMSENLYLLTEAVKSNTLATKNGISDVCNCLDEIKNEL